MASTFRVFEVLLEAMVRRGRKESLGPLEIVGQVAELDNQGTKYVTM